MPAIAFTTANYVARETGWSMHGWDHGDRATHERFRPLETYGERLDEILEKVRSLGFDTVDLWGAHLGTDWATDEHLAVARASLERLELRVATYATWVRPSNVERACELARGIGTSIIGAGFSGEPEALAPVLREYDVRLAVENHPERTPGDVLSMIERGGGTFGTTVDTGWWGTQGYEPQRAIVELGEHVLHVHLKDVRAVGEPHETCVWGEGVVDVEACVKELRRSAYDGALTIEHEPEDHDPSDEIVQLRSHLEAWLSVNVAIVGCGNIAEHYANRIVAAETLTLVGVTDAVPERAEALARAFDVTQFASLEELLGDDAVDVVVNLTVPSAHASVTAAALEAGKHVHTEKPVALRYDEARELLELAQRTGRRLSCSPATLLGEAQQQVWKLVRDGALGQVRVVYAEANWGRIESWHPTPQALYAVGPLVDVGVYPLTILTAMFGPVRRVVAYGATLERDHETLAGEPFVLTTPDFIVSLLSSTARLSRG